MAFRHAFPSLATNRLLTTACTGTAVTVFGAWNYSQRGLVYEGLNSTTTSLKSQGLLPQSTELPNPRTFGSRLQDNFLLKTTDPTNYVSWIGSAFSHQNLPHIAFNLLTWSSFGPLLYFLPTRHYAALIFGSAITSSFTWLRDQQRTGRPGAALGSSGIVSGLMATVTMFAPTARAAIFGIVPAPLWMITGGYFLLDTYLMQSETRTGIGHSAHIGGGAFGILYYGVFLRRWGGVLGKRI